MKKIDVVVIKKAWHQPEIKVTVNSQELGIEMSLVDFIKASLAEAGSPALVLTKASLEKKLLAAAEVVLNGMKKESTHGVAQLPNL